jgi:uncharacterized protein YndB with AHSA1/START domain
VILPAPPEAVWESLTDSEQISSWLGADVELDLRPGGVLRLRAGDGARMGVVEAVTPFEHLAFRWRPVIDGPHGRVLGPGTRVEFDLEPRDRDTYLLVVETLLSSAPAHSIFGASRDGRLGHPRLRAMATAGAPR